MHIPDNYLSPSTCIVMGAAMIPVWKRAVFKVKNELSKKKLPMLGICAAFSFLIMMFNIPLPGGTSGHAVGATLAAILLGPDAAVISVTIALAIQALFFGDGGILAFGANAFNMAFVIPYAGYYIYRFIKQRTNNKKIEYAAVFIASYVAINLAALFAGIEFGIQPLLFKDVKGLPLYCPYPLKVSIPAMVIPHVLAAGILEGLITVGVYVYINKTSPSLIYEGGKQKMSWIYGLIAALIILCPVGLIASGTAWGEWDLGEIKNAIGFVPKGMKNGFKFNALMPDYSFGKISSTLGYILSALIGVAIIVIIIKLFSKKEADNN